jgi:hypothetical protein
MKPSYVLVLFAFPMVFLLSCKKEEVQELDLGYDYFPNTVGSYIIYKVDSTHYGIEEEQVIFQRKEQYAYQFIDASGEEAIAVERYKRPGTGSPWVLEDVWVQKRTPTKAERVEENNRFIRMVFPVEEGKTWNGNAYNTLSEWDYTYEDIDQPADIGILEFSKTLKVNQRYNVNLVDQEVAYELYARNVGLIYRRFTDLNTQQGEVSGVQVITTAVAYGNVN